MSSEARVSPPRLPPRLRFYAVIAVLMLVALAGIARLWLDPPPITSQGVFALTFPPGKDFCNLYTIGRMWRAGVPLADAYDTARYARFQSDLLGRELPVGHYVWSYPPSMDFAALPLAALPYMPALLVWLAGTLALLVLAARSLELRGPYALLLALSPAAVFNVYFGHVGFLLGALVLAGFGWLERRPQLAGVCFGLATVKPQLLLMVPFLLLGRRAWRAIAAAALTAGALFLASGIAFGFEAWTAYASHAAETQRRFLEQSATPPGKAIPLFQLLLVTPFFTLRNLGAGVEVSYVVQALLALGAAWVAWRLAARGAPTARLAAWAATGAFLASPYAMAYDLVLVAAACLLLVREQTARSAFLPLAWLLPLLTVFGNYVRLPFAPLVLVGLAWAIAAPGRSATTEIAAT